MYNVPVLNTTRGEPNTTLEVVRTSFYWKHMIQDVRAFVIDCSVCQTEKSSHL